MGKNKKGKDKTRQESDSKSNTQSPPEELQIVGEASHGTVSLVQHVVYPAALVVLAAALAVVLSGMIAALLAMGIALTVVLWAEPHYFRKRSRTVRAFLTLAVWILVVGGLFLASGFWRAKSDDASEPFAVEVETTFVQEHKTLDGARFYLAYRSGYGDTVSPVDVTMFLKVVNLQQTRVMVQSFSVEMNLGGRWTRLVRLIPRGGEIYFATEGLHKARRIDVRPNGFDYLIQDRYIEPRETVRGWAFFEIPENFKAPLGTGVQYRVKIRDTAGREFVYTSPKEVLGSRPLAPGSDVAQPRDLHVKEWADLSGYHKKFYSQPVP